ncbi:MAG TPA: hypothetical protein VGL07_17095, partial [Buttiauxella sp.]
MSNIKTVTSGVNLKERSLIADMQYYESFTSEALNRKFFGVLPHGIYNGFDFEPGEGLSVCIGAENERGSALSEHEMMCLTANQMKTVMVAVPAGKESLIVLEVAFSFGTITDQVSPNSPVKAAEIKAISRADYKKGQVIICTAVVPADAIQVTTEMLHADDRQIATLGASVQDVINTLSRQQDPLPQYLRKNQNLGDVDDAAVSLTNLGGLSTLAANTMFTNLVDNAPDNLNTLGLLAKALGGDPDFAANVAKSLSGMMSQKANGSDINNVETFIKNLGLKERGFEYSSVSNFGTKTTIQKEDFGGVIVVAAEGQTLTLPKMSD